MLTQRRTDEQTGITMLKARSPNIVRLYLVMNILGRFSKIHQTFLYTLSSEVGKKNRETDIMVYHQICAAQLQKKWKISELFTDNVAVITLLSVRATRLQTRSIGRHKCFEVGKTRFQIRSRKSIILRVSLIAALSYYISYYVTITVFLTLPIYYKLQNAQWSRTVIWSVQFALNKSRYPLDVWTECNSAIAQGSMQLVWCWLTFLH
jgi:hypothetical protein